MNTKIIEYLLALDKYNSFSYAARACGVSQPTLSIQIRKFEEELGISLLERQTKGFIFTQVGKTILEKARPILQGVREINQMAEFWSDPYSGDLIIGAFPTLAPYLFPVIIQDLVDSYPNLKIFLVEEKTDILLQKLKAGEIDVAFLALPEDDPALEYAKLFEEEFLLAVPKQHHWGLKSIINSKELQKEQLLLLDEGHCLRHQALELCSKSGNRENVNFRASSMTTLLQMIEMGNGVSLVPECVATNNLSINFIKITTNPPKRGIGLFWRKTSVRKKLFEELVDDLSR